MKAGMNYINLTAKQLAMFIETDSTSLNIQECGFLENEYVVIKHEDKVYGKYKVKNDKLARVPFITIGKKNEKFSPRNIEQECYFDLLNDDSITIKVAIGLAGSGKTKSAIKFGFDKITDKDSNIQKIMLVRNPVAVGERVGYFKGDKIDKLTHWNNPFKDNIQYDRQDTLEELIGKGIVELEFPATMQGRDIKNTWIIVDECQQMTTEQVKMIGERVSEGSYIIFIGDLGQVFHKKYETNNGLRRLLNLKGQKMFGSVELIDDVRSLTSKVFATLY